jgi:hypothetical protein
VSSPCIESRKRQQLEDQSFGSLLGMDNSALARVDPLAINLHVARGIPLLAHLRIVDYQCVADKWASGVTALIDKLQHCFHRDPSYFKNDISFFRLGVLCQFVKRELGVSYAEEHREKKEVVYTNPSDLFVNGVMDTRQGTCGNMAVLHLALAWRLGWSVSLACAGNHFYLKYDDGKTHHNIETTNNRDGAFQSHPDEYYRKTERIPDIAVRCGSDLRALLPRELMGVFVALRGRHFRDVGNIREAEKDFLLSRYLFPNYRVASREQIAISVKLNASRFEPHEAGHPRTVWCLEHEAMTRAVQNGQQVPFNQLPPFTIRVPER